MNAKHTPGPWKILKGRKGFLGQPENEWKDQWEVRAQEPKMFGGTTVFNLGVSFDKYTDQEEANARLIASAPILLAALKTLLSLDVYPIACTNLDDFVISHRAFTDAKSMAEKVIASVEEAE